MYNLKELNETCLRNLMDNLKREFKELDNIYQLLVHSY